MANKPTEQTLTFARFCINLEVQERLEEGARELLGLADQEEDAMYWVDSTGEVVVHNHLDVGRAVFKEVLKTSQGELPLKADLVRTFFCPRPVHGGYGAPVAARQQSDDRGRGQGCGGEVGLGDCVPTKLGERCSSAAEVPRPHVLPACGISGHLLAIGRSLALLLLGAISGARP